MDFLIGAVQFIFFGFIILCLLLWGISKFTEDMDEIFGWSEKREKKKIDDLTIEFINEVNSIISKDSDKIKSAYRNLVSSDAFGEKDYEKFKKEITKFFLKKSKVHKEMELEGYSYRFGDKQYDDIIKGIEKAIKKEDRESKFDPKMSPYDYESFCANEFNKNGWEAAATGGSSDQGVDVIAKKKGSILAGQCKMFSKPVGNKAVQEIVAGMKYYKATTGIVIATNGFTKSAYALAEANNIKLIHHSEIKDL